MSFQNQIHPRVVRQLLLLIVVVVLGGLLYLEMHFMLGAFLGALALYMLLRMPMFYLAYTRRWNKALSAVLLIVLSIAIIVMPLAWVVSVLAQAIKPLLADTTKMQQALQSIDRFLHDRYSIDLLSNDVLAKLPALAAGMGSAVLSTTFSTLTNLVIMYFLLYFMLVKGGEMERWVRANLPLKHTNTNKLIKEVREVVISNTIGIPVLGAVQGIVAMLGYTMFGIESPVMWGVMTGIASVIPFVGTMAAWVPLTILTFAKGDAQNGYWLLFWGLVVIGGSDNVFRFILQKYIADIHPIITVFGVIIGLNMFGFLGLIFGPLLISLFFMLVRIYYDEYVTDHDAEGSELHSNAGQ